MSDSEQILGKLGNREIYFTNKRFIFINTLNPKYAPAGGGLVGALIGEAIFHFDNKKADKKKEETKDSTIDEKLQKIKGSYAITYDSITGFIASKSRSGGQVCIQAKNGWKYFDLVSKDEFSQIAAILPTIIALKGKFTLNT